MNESYLHFTITPAMTGLTIEKYLRQKLKLSARQISSLKFRPQGILVNGTKQRISYVLSAGEQLSIQTTDQQKASSHLVPVEGTLQILYEDTVMIIVSKPAGLVVHPSGAHYADTLANQLTHYFKEKQETVTLSAIGRLDKDTSGVVLFAKHAIAAAKLSSQREHKTLQKTYLAIVKGELLLEENCIDLPLRPKPENPYQIEVHPDGLHAVTHYKLLTTVNENSLIEVQLETGRMHQIRAHMAAAGRPLLGDCLYNPLPNHEIFFRAALHAWKLTLQQPFTEEEITVYAPLPEDFQTYLQTYMPDTLTSILT